MAPQGVFVLINGVDVSAKVRQQSLRLDLVLLHRGDTAQFEVWDTTGTFSCSELQTVLVFDGWWNLKFQGQITKKRRSVPDPVTVVWLITAQDYSFQLQKTLANKKYQNQTVDYIVRDLIATYAPGYTTNNVQSNLPLLPTFNVNHLRLGDALDKLTRMGSVGPVFLVWDVDSNKDVHFYDSSHCPTADVSVSSSDAAYYGYQSDVTSDSTLAVYFPLQEYVGATTAHDLSSSREHAAVFGSVTFASATPALVNDSATGAVFDGSTGYVEGPAVYGPYSGSVTLEAWVNTSYIGFQSVITLGSLSAQGGMAMAISSTGTFYGGITGYTVDSQVKVADGKWHLLHVVYSQQAGTISLYVDGVLEYSYFTVAWSLASGSRAWVGIFPDGTAHFNGAIQHVAGYTSAYTASQVSARVRASYGKVVTVDRQSFYFEEDASQLTTSVTIRGASFVSNAYTQNWVGNGSQTSFQLDYAPNTDTTSSGYVPTVTVGGTSQTVALDSGSGFGSNQVLVSIDQPTQTATLKFATAPGNGVVVSTTYVFNIPVVTTMVDTISLGLYGKLEEYVVDTKIVSQPAAARRAAGELGQFSRVLDYIHAELEYNYVGQLVPGQIFWAKVPQINLLQQFIVTRCTISGLGGGRLRHAVDAVGQPS